MHRISEATIEDFEEILAFLRRNGVYENPWFLWEVCRSLQRPEEGSRIVLCRSGNSLVGLESFFDYTTIPQPDPYPDRNHQLAVSLDAVDRGALAELLNELPTEKMGQFIVSRPFILEYFRGLPDANVHDPQYFYTVSRERFKPVEGEAVVELTAADAGLFEGCERKFHLENFEGEHRNFAILRNSKLGSSVGTGPIPPKRPDLGQRAVAISGLHTETPYRRLGLGRRLVSYVTELILREGNVPFYWTEHDNIASQNLAKSLGYWQFAEQRSCYWRKPEGFRGL
jgi:GNAT superfamily N-acetyltransferase